MNGKVFSSFELVAVPELEDMGLASQLEFDSMDGKNMEVQILVSSVCTHGTRGGHASTLLSVPLGVNLLIYLLLELPNSRGLSQFRMRRECDLCRDVGSINPSSPRVGGWKILRK